MAERRRRRPHGNELILEDLINHGVWMRLRLTAFGLLLIFITLGATTSLPSWAQPPSAFSFTLQGSSMSACWIYRISFSATQGQQFTVRWDQNQTGVGPVSLNLYIARSAEVDKIWLCDDGPVSLYWRDGAYGTVNWAAPSTGGYAIVLVNYSYNSISGAISLTTINATLSATAMGPTTVRRKPPVCFSQVNC